MEKLITITFMILSIAALTFTPQTKVTTDNGPGCIVMQEVIDACTQSGGRFDYTLCSCVGGGELTEPSPL